MSDGKGGGKTGALEYNPYEERQRAKEHPMREIHVEKVVINIGVGESGEKLLKAARVIELLTGHRSIQTLSKTTNKDLGIRKGMPIGVKSTLRGKEAEEFVKRALWVKENRIAEYSFDREGNFSIGIPDYTSFEGMKYDPDIGIFGLDVNVVLRRKGYRVAKRKARRGRIPHSHRITREEGIEYAKRVFNAEVVE